MTFIFYKKILKKSIVFVKKRADYIRARLIEESAAGSMLVPHHLKFSLRCSYNKLVVG